MKSTTARLCCAWRTSPMGLILDASIRRRGPQSCSRCRRGRGFPSRWFMYRLAISSGWPDQGSTNTRDSDRVTSSMPCSQ